MERGASRVQHQEPSQQAKYQKLRAESQVGKAEAKKPSTKSRNTEQSVLCRLLEINRWHLFQ
jgi:hypothetical protein